MQRTKPTTLMHAIAFLWVSFGLLLANGGYAHNHAASMGIQPPSDDAAISALLDGLHRDAASANFDPYFDRFTEDAVFLGTDRLERWSVPDFKAYAKPYFDAGRGWTYTVRERHVMGADTTNDHDEAALGTIRWFDEVLWNEKYGHCRGTGSVIKTTQGWRIAHYSLTFLIPNDVAAEVTQIARDHEMASAQ